MEAKISQNVLKQAILSMLFINYTNSRNLLLRNFCEHSTCIEKGYLKKIHICVAGLYILYLYNLQESTVVGRMAGSWFTKHMPLCQSIPCVEPHLHQASLICPPGGRNHTTDCWIALRQFCLPSFPVIKKNGWLLSTCCFSSQMSIREFGNGKPSCLPWTGSIHCGSYELVT